jgi:hypothetical protein
MKGIYPKRIVFAGDQIQILDPPHTSSPATVGYPRMGSALISVCRAVANESCCEGQCLIHWHLGYE